MAAIAPAKASQWVKVYLLTFLALLVRHIRTTAKILTIKKTTYIADKKYNKTLWKNVFCFLLATKVILYHIFDTTITVINIREMYKTIVEEYSTFCQEKSGPESIGYGVFKKAAM